MVLKVWKTLKQTDLNSETMVKSPVGEHVSVCNRHIKSTTSLLPAAASIPL